MDEQQVDIVGLQLAQALVDAAGGFLLAGVRYPYLCREEQFLAFQSAAFPGAAHALFVLIGLGGIYQPIANAQRIGHTALTLFGRDEEHPVAQ